MNTKFLRSWRNRSRLSRRQAMAQTPTAATRAEINSASLNHAYRVNGGCVYRKPHMGISESRGKKSLVHELRLRCLFRYPRSKPDSVIWLFLARSTSHPVVAQSDCTNIPLAAGGAQEDETILNCGFSGHGFRRFVHLDPPGLTVLED